MKQEIIDKINRLASQDEPFLFVINYQGDKAFIRLLSDINPEECLFDFEGRGNLSHVWKETWKEETSEKEISETTWQIEPPSPSENGCLGCIIEGRTAITTPPKPL